MSRAAGDALAPKPFCFSEALSGLEPVSSGLHPESVPQPQKGEGGARGHLPPGPPGWRCARPASLGLSGPWAAEPLSCSPSWPGRPWRTWLPPVCLLWGLRA